MGRTGTACRPLPWLFAAVIAALLSITSVHGATSVAAPAGAMANAYASIGAALFRQPAPAGRGEETGEARAAARPDPAAEPRPPADPPTPPGVAGTGPAVDGTVGGAALSPPAGPGLTSRLPTGTGARAPPAH